MSLTQTAAERLSRASKAAQAAEVELRHLGLVEASRAAQDAASVAERCLGLTQGREWMTHADYAAERACLEAVAGHPRRAQQQVARAVALAHN